MVAQTRIPPPPTSSKDGTIWNNWYLSIKDAINNIRNDSQWTDLTDNGESTLHYHASDRERANHTGTQTLATISDAGTAASQSGLSVVITTAPVTGGGTTGSMTFTNGVLTAQTPAT